MKMTNKEYSRYVEKKSANSHVFSNLCKAFLVGGIICCIGQALMNGYGAIGLDKEASGTAVSISLVFLGVLLTGIGLYDDLAKFAGGGSLVPITGFANSVSSPALEFKTEGEVTGTCAKMFIIAGPVIVFGVVASAIYGAIYYLFLI